MTTTDRAYDLVLLGATGFAGNLTAEHLADRLADADARWAVAGRDRDRLGRLAARLPGDPEVEIVDVTDLPGLLALAGRTRVLATTVGPYARLGELVVQACVRQGTDYCDITGEPAFVELIRDRYGTDAANRGVRLVSCCGFDSVPPDLGVQLAVEQLPPDTPITVRGYVHADARFSGGTMATALEGIAGGRPSQLAPPAITTDERSVASTPRRIHRVHELGAWGVPLPTVDPLVVLRSAARLDAYGPAFRYGHFAEASRLTTALGGIAAVGVLGAMAQLAPTRALLRRVMPDPGEGPSAERRASSRFRATFLADGAGERVAVRVSGGDPGYDETAVMLGEAALALAQDDLPDVAGALTPAVALGPVYRRRLTDQGLGFAVLEPAELAGPV